MVVPVGIEPTTVCVKCRCSTIEQLLTYCDVLPLLLNNLLDYPIQHTTYLWTCGLLSHISREMSYCPFPINIALKPLDATPRTIILPFLVPIDKLVS